MIVVNVDLDGCVYPFVEVMAAATELQGRFGELRGTPHGVPFKVPTFPLQLPDFVLGSSLGKTFPMATKYDFWEEWDMSAGEWNGHFRRGVEEGFIWGEGLPYDGAVKALWELSDVGYHLRIVTRRLVHTFGHKHAVTTTVAWLDKHVVPYRSISFIEDEPKSYYPADVLIDDTPEYVYEFVDTVEDSIGIIFKRAWNMYYPYTENPRIYICETWEEVKNVIQAIKPIQEA